MRLLHTGDLHLDSAFSSFGHKDAESYREYGRTLLKNIFECAKHEKCEMILIAGDLFDSKFVSPDTRALFVSLVRNADIPVLIAPGNHDPYTENSFYSLMKKEAIENLYLFESSRLQFFDFDSLRVRVFGYAFTSSVLSESPLLTGGKGFPEDNGYLRLLCAHADLSSPISRYAPISLTELVRFGFAYSALGHIHNRAEKEDTDGRVRYCGFAEGRSFDELGEGGVFIVDVDELECTVSRRVLSSRAFFVESLDMPSDVGLAEERIRELVRAKDYSEGVNLRIELTGTAEPYEVKRLTERVDELCEELGLESLELIDSTLPLYDGSYLERDVTLRGEVYRALIPQLTSADESERRQALLALKIALAAIDGGNVFDVAK